MGRGEKKTRRPPGREGSYSMEERSGFRYPLQWHTQFPGPCALKENRIFYRHADAGTLRRDFSGAAGPHPRLMASAQDFESLRQRIQTDGRARKWYESLYARAERLAADTVPPEKPERHTLQNRLLVLCLIYRLCKEHRFLERALQELFRYCSFSTWMPDEKLDAGYILKGIAIGYDWLYPEMSGAQRETVRTAVLQNAFWAEREVYRAPCRQGLDAHYILQNTNHNVSINCGMIMAACALFDEPELTELCAEILSGALWALENYLPEFLEHGCGKEGVYYWYWPMTSTVEIVESLRTCFGTDYGICETPGFRRMGFFPVYMTGASGREFNWGNADENTFAVSGVLFALSNLLRDSRFAQCRLQAMDAYGDPAGPYDLLWYRPLEETAPLPEDMYFCRTESVGMFSRLFDRQALSVCLKGGWNNEVHGSLCAGSFVLDALGERWASLPGAERYSVPHYWDYGRNGTRWTYYRMRAEGQNAMVLDPGAGPDQDPFAFCPVIRYACAPEACCAVVDAAPAFAHRKNISYARRGAFLADGRTHVLLQDEVGGEGISYWWMMQTTAQITLSDGGRTAELSQNGRRLRVTLRCARPDAVFGVMPAQPLPSSPHPAENSPNDRLTKLVVHLQVDGDLLLAVQFDPVSENAARPPEIPLLPMAQWPGDERESLAP